MNIAGLTQGRNGSSDTDTPAEDDTTDDHLSDREPRTDDDGTDDETRVTDTENPFTSDLVGQ